MTTARQLQYFDATNSSPSGQFNQGPWTISDLGKLLVVQVHGSISAAAPTAIVGDYLVAGLNWGLQSGAEGFTPANSITAVDNFSFIWTGTIPGADLLAAWAPSTDTAGVLNGYSLEYKWAGQQDFGASTDFYLSFANPFGTSIGDYNVSGTIEFLHT